MKNNRPPARPRKPATRKIEIPDAMVPHFVVGEVDEELRVGFYSSPIGDGESVGLELAQVAANMLGITAENAQHTPAWLKSELRKAGEAFVAALKGAKISVSEEEGVAEGEGSLPA